MKDCCIFIAISYSILAQHKKAKCRNLI